MKAYLLLINLMLANLGLAQVPADSLEGTYAGNYMYSSPPGSAWMVMPDTFYIANVDSVNCVVNANDSYISTGNVYYYSTYFSCNSTPPTNYFTQFYNLDSLRVIDDSVPQPWPNPSYSVRFYGKRIGPLPIGIKGNKEKEELIKVWPNPTSGFLSINTQDIKGQVKISIVNAVGEEIKKQHKELKNNLYELDVSDLPEGIYLLRIETEKGIMTKKVVVE